MSPGKQQPYQRNGAKQGRQEHQQQELNSQFISGSFPEPNEPNLLEPSSALQQQLFLPAVAVDGLWVPEQQQGTTQYGWSQSLRQASAPNVSSIPVNMNRPFASLPLPALPAQQQESDYFSSNETEAAASGIFPSVLEPTPLPESDSREATVVNSFTGAAPEVLATSEPQELAAYSDNREANVASSPVGPRAPSRRGYNVRIIQQPSQYQHHDDHHQPLQQMQQPQEHARLSRPHHEGDPSYSQRPQPQTHHLRTNTQAQQQRQQSQHASFDDLQEIQELRMIQIQRQQLQTLMQIQTQQVSQLEQQWRYQNQLLRAQSQPFAHPSDASAELAASGSFPSSSFAVAQCAGPTAPNNEPSSSASRRRQQSRMGIWKDADRPKRPLTAYNFFFQRERARLLSEARGDSNPASAAPTAVGHSSSSVAGLLSDSRSNAVITNIKAASDIHSDDDVKPSAVSTSSLASDILVYEQTPPRNEEEIAEISGSATSGPDPSSDSAIQLRKRRKKDGRGTVGFAEMARIISQRWSEITPETRQELQDLANRDKERYLVEKAAYLRNKKEREEKDDNDEE